MHKFRRYFNVTSFELKKRKKLTYIFIITGFLIVLVSYFTVYNRRIIKVLSFKNCQIKYPQYSKGFIELHEGHYLTNEMEYEIALRKLGYCLCQYYSQTKDTSVSKKIFELYKKKYNYFPSFTKQGIQPIDSVAKYRAITFDTVLLID